MEKRCLGGKSRWKVETWSIQEYTQTVNDLSYGLINAGIKKVTKLPLFPPTDPNGILQIWV
jgi:hypothetical protein